MAGTYASYSSTGRSEIDFQRLAKTIGTNIQKISQNESSMQRMIHQLGTVNDTEQLRAKLHDIEHYTKQLAKDTTTSLKEMQTITFPSSSLSEQKQWKMQRERLKNDFSDALLAFQKAQHSAAQKETESVKKAKAQANKNFFDDDAPKALIQLESPTEFESTTLQLQEDDTSVEMIREREKAIRQLEADIVDVNQIFKDLAQLVYEQGDVIDSIEANIENTHISVSQGTQQLQQARQHQSSYRRKMCFCIGILITIALIICIIVAVQLS